jgi:hypothetical protein
MAISIRGNAGAWAASNATTQTVTLPTHQTGDMLIVRAVRKPFTNPDDITIGTAGWNPVGTGVANGATANGNGVGSMAFKAFYKVATSAAETNPVVTWGTTSAPGAACAVVYQLGAGEVWVTPVGTGGGDTTARTAQTSTMSSHIPVVAGDLCDFFRAACDDSGALTVPTITQTGVTFAAVAEQPAAAGLFADSNDIATDGGYRLATAGTSSAAAVITGTSAASEQHGAWQTRLRVQVSDPQTATPTTAALVTATFEPTVTTTNNQTATPTTPALTTATFAPTVSATAHQLVTPGLVALTTATFAPTVTASDHKTVTPTTASLTLSTLIPTVTASDNKTAIPTTASLTTATFAPTVDVSADQTVTPTTASLVLATFAPTVTATNNQTVTPGVASLVIATFAPTVSATANVLAVPATRALILTTYAPTIPGQGDEDDLSWIVTDRYLDVTVKPRTARLRLVTYPPRVLVVDDEDVMELLRIIA